ncbi:MAG: CvpA family protein [Spirochaetaceae bacterium]|jgi:membrane protein required for colicin V production|nr:CvpA family protein [Spirochaetaceae bacterium]
MQQIVPIDMICLVFVLLFAVRGALRGFLDELLSIAFLVLGLVGAALFYKPGADLIRTKVPDDIRFLPEMLAFGAVFCIIFVVVKVLELLVKDVINRLKLGAVDRVLGVFFGLIEGLVLVTLLLFLLTVQPFFDIQSLIKKSVFAELLMPVITHYFPTTVRLPALFPQDL